MSGFESLGRFLLIIGGVTFLLGLVLTLAGRIPWAGQLPGDIVIRRERFGCYIPLATSILVSILLTLLLNLVVRMLKR
jgi:hypothetical protein